jgi:hypothetical protein
MSENKTITVTSPLFPKLEEFIPMLQDIWNRKWLTNNGHYHQELEKDTCRISRRKVHQPFYQRNLAADYCTAGNENYRGSHYHTL